MDNEPVLNPTIQKLQSFKEKGFVFHGSSNPNIQILEPRKTKEVDPRRIFNIDTAVFADISYVSPILFAVVNKDRIAERIGGFNWSVHWDSNGIPMAKIPLKAKEYVESAKGIVYVLPGENFIDRHGSQAKSKVSVAPLDRIEVNLQDYYDAGGKLEWIK